MLRAAIAVCPNIKHDPHLDGGQLPNPSNAGIKTVERHKTANT